MLEDPFYIFIERIINEGPKKKTPLLSIIFLQYGSVKQKGTEFTKIRFILRLQVGT